MSETQKGYEIDPEGAGLSYFMQSLMYYQVFLFELIPHAPIKVLLTLHMWETHFHFRICECFYFKFH